MLQCDVSDIRADLLRLEQRIEHNRREFFNQVQSAPCCALSLMEAIAADRARHLHLTLLARGLSTDYDCWAQATMDQRMQQVGFSRISSHQPLYVRPTVPGLDLSDLFSVIHIESSDINNLIAGLRLQQS